MTTPTHDDTTHDTTRTTIGGTPAAAAAVVERVDAALTALAARYWQLTATRPSTDEGHAHRCATLALDSARRAGWWRVLLTHEDSNSRLHPLFYRAALAAHARERSDARFWRDTARDWQARAEHRPTSDAAGALSNRDELGVTA